MPALSSAPRRVVPSVTMRCLPSFFLRLGKSLTRMTRFSAWFSTRSPPRYSTIRGFTSLPEQSGEVSMWAIRPMTGPSAVPGTEP